MNKQTLVNEDTNNYTHRSTGKIDFTFFFKTVKMLSITKNNIRQPASVGSEELHILKSNTVTLKIFKKSLFNRPAISHRSNASRLSLSIVLQIIQVRLITIYRLYPNSS